MVNISNNVKFNYNNFFSIYNIGLRKDINNSFRHTIYIRILGEHSQCKSYFCKGTKVNEINLMYDPQKSGMVDEILQIVGRLTTNANSLLMNVDNNICEQFNSIINKHLAEKELTFINVIHTVRV